MPYPRGNSWEDRLKRFKGSLPEFTMFWAIVFIIVALCSLFGFLYGLGYVHVQLFGMPELPHSQFQKGTWNYKVFHVGLFDAVGLFAVAIVTYILARLYFWLYWVWTGRDFSWKVDWWLGLK